MILVRETRTPESSAARSFPPIAYTWRPNGSAGGHDVSHKREDPHKPDGVVDSQKVARSQNLESGIAILGTSDQVGKGVAIIPQASDTARHVHTFPGWQ